MRFQSISAVFLLAAMLAGCGGDDPAESTDPGTGGGGSGGGSGSGGSGATGQGGAPVGPEGWPSAECRARTADLLAQMTREEKAAQMAMPTVNQVGPAEITSQMLGAVFGPGSPTTPDTGSTEPAAWFASNAAFQEAALSSRLGIPILIGVDAVHGHSGLTGTVIFPHNIGLGCTRNVELAERAGEITGIELAATGFNWTYGPMVSVAWDDRWGRTYETFSEDPELTEQLGAAVVRGIQGRNGLGSDGRSVIACAKHFAADGQATFGTSAKGGTLDRGNLEIDLDTMRTYGINPYREAVASGLGSVMVSDARWNDNDMTHSSQLMTEILKGEMGFQGFIATDWDAGNTVTAVMAGADSLMHPTAGYQADIDAILGGVSDERLDDAVTRILNTKCEAGLFEWQRDDSLLALVGSPAHREVARQAVRESLVLLQNDNAVLPLAKDASVFVTGTGADDIGRQCGGWSVAWQGASGPITAGTSISQGIGNVATLASSAAEADVVVVVLSETPYAEFLGDVSDIDTLPGEDFTALADARASGKPVVAIVVSGRPVQIADHLTDADAWVAAWLPGTEGDGVADVLFGDHDFSGTLSHSWPRDNDGANVNYYDAGYDPLFQFGFGLTLN